MINKQTRKISNIFFVFVFVSAIFLFGFYLGNNDKGQNNVANLAYSEEAKQTAMNGDKESFDFNLYFEVWHNLKTSHFNKNTISDRDLFYGSLEGLAAAAGDPYTVFMDPKLTDEFYEDLSGTFEGIGAEIGLRDEMITVVAPLDGMPAQKAGLRAGDKVYAINGESALGLTVSQAVKNIRGPKGTEVMLTVIRGEGKPIDIKIIRDQIFVASVKTEMLDNNIYLIKVSNFNDDTDELFNKAINDVLLKQPQGIVLDLRNNPGGYLDTAVRMASEWIEEGPVVAEQFSENKRNEHFSNGQARLKNFKTIVLINEGSASASEIVAGALRDYKKATILGAQSFGKGSVQTIKDLSDGSSLKITVANWLTPAGDYINDKGITPDIIIDLNEDNINKDQDPQLDKALELLKNK